MPVPCIRLDDRDLAARGSLLFVNRTKRLLGLLRSPSIASAALHAFTGIGFIGATLVMARLLSPEQFGIATLLVALANLGTQASPAGFNGAVIRHALRAETRLLFWGGLTALVAGAILATIGWSVYKLDLLSCGLVLIAVAFGGATLLAMSSLQREHLFMRSVMLSQSGNFALMLAALVMLLGYGRNQWFAVAVTACWFAAVVIPVWIRLLRRSQDGARLSAVHAHDVAQFAGVALGIQLMIQLERLLIPVALELRDLASFAIVAAIALSPYRLLEMGTTQTLAARVRTIEAFAARRRLAKRETLMMLGLCLIGAVPIVAMGPYVCAMVAPDTVVGRELIAIGVFSGIIRVMGAQGRAIASAFADPADLRLLNITGWMTVAFGALCGYALSHFGVFGVMCGVSFGWMARAIVSFLIARKFLWETAPPLDSNS